MDDEVRLKYFGLREDSDKSDKDDEYMIQLKRQNKDRLTFTPVTLQNFNLWNEKFIRKLLIISVE